MDLEHLPDHSGFEWRRLPVLLADRLGVRPATLLVGAIAVVGAGFGAWWALRPPPVAIEELVPSVDDVPLLIPSTTVRNTAVVHVDGAVAHPGIHEVQLGSRVADAITAAGGMTENADRRQLNLAELVSDGQRIWVPVEGEDIPAIGGAGALGAGTSGSSSGAVSINHASATDLQQLSGIGPSLAAAIVEFRERNGPFRSVDDLLSVPGIGPAKLAALRDQASV